MLRPLLLALALTAAPPVLAAREAKGFFPYPSKVEKLPNGLTVVRVPFASPGLVAYYTVVRVGSRNEVEPGHTGFAHFFEHVMFKGTARYPQGKRGALLSGWGFADNAFTTDDFTIYHSLGPSSRLHNLIEIEADRFQNLSYSKETFQTEAKAVLGEYHKSAAMPELKLEETLGETAFTVHPYRHTTLGFYDDVKAMPDKYDYSLQFFKRWYTPDNATLFIVGDFDDAQVMAAIKTRYGGWKGQSAQVAIPSEPPQKEPRLKTIDWPSPTLPRLLLAWHTPAARLDDKSTAIQTVLTDYLVGSSSPLFKSLVLEKQSTERVLGGYFPHRDPHLFLLQARLRDETKRAEVTQALEGAITALAEGKVDAKRVATVKSNLRYSLLMGLETPDNVAEQLALFTGIFGEPDALDRHYRKVAEVQPANLVAFAKRYLGEAQRIEVDLKLSASKPQAQIPAPPH